ncbi:GNAT family N-acetyltransferase [Kitasatospora sp. MBT63]|uniref:GNAT family N-acetyltransferase n=1 Tax=Kitasatospora sp. MBT63 TaxID=1444768 RepID=UPI00053BABBC|nr:GNAT family N-acetyltransferase [Kitasatospora sp. MBT63]
MDDTPQEQERVTDDPRASRYEIRIGPGAAAGTGEPVGFAEYHLSEGELALIHTEVDPVFEGRGLAGRLVRAALDDARRRGLAVLPYCPYVRKWIGRHPDFTDLVPADRRARFGL